jgi:transcriptional repressor NrdR
MRCPYCFNEDTKVVDKRDSKDSTRRRRECLKCEKRFTTYEKPEVNLIVIKKDGRKEDFDRAKLKKGILLSCEKRPSIDEETVEEIVDIIEAKLKRKSTEVDSRIIGEMVMKKLLKLDKVAYVRFASVYRSFGDVKDLEKELKLIKEK